MNMNDLKSMKRYDSYKVNNVTRDLRRALRILQDMGACGAIKQKRSSKKRYLAWDADERRINRILGIEPDGYFLIAIEDACAISMALEYLQHAYKEMKKLQDEAKGQVGEWR